MLLTMPTLDRIARGEIDRAFRRWRRPTVRAGGTLNTPRGQLTIEAVDPVTDDDLTDDEARRAGFADADALRRSLPPRAETTLVRVRFGPLAADPRLALRADDDLDPDTLADLRTRLDRLDRGGAWTRDVLTRIAAHPGRRAADLADDLGTTTEILKPRVRRLKALGLTESLEVGYRLSPRGEAWLTASGGRSELPGGHHP